MGLLEVPGLSLDMDKKRLKKNIYLSKRSLCIDILPIHTKLHDYLLF